jgi:hypothetical protein
MSDLVLERFDHDDAWRLVLVRAARCHRRRAYEEDHDPRPGWRRKIR